jgi:hypothetical protein
MKVGLADLLLEAVDEVGPHVADRGVHGVVARAGVDAPPGDLRIEGPLTPSSTGRDTAVGRRAWPQRKGHTAHKARQRLNPICRQPEASVLYRTLRAHLDRFLARDSGEEGRGLPSFDAQTKWSWLSVARGGFALRVAAGA